MDCLRDTHVIVCNYTPALHTAKLTLPLNHFPIHLLCLFRCGSWKIRRIDKVKNESRPLQNRHAGQKTLSAEGLLYAWAELSLRRDSSQPLCPCTRYRRL